MFSDNYFKKTIEILTEINNTQSEKILAVSDMAAETIKNDGIIYIFGCGHSHLIALDSFYRAGGLANVSAILDTDLMLHNGAAKSSAMEKMPGIAKHILKRYCVTENDMLIIVSTSGKNAVPVEMAIEAKKAGIKTAAIVSSAYFDKKTGCEALLYEEVDVYVDNLMPYGDVTVELESSKVKMGSVSTIACSFIMQSILLNAADKCGKDGIEIPVYMSGNVEGGKEYNAKIVDKFLPRIKHL